MNQNRLPTVTKISEEIKKGNRILLSRAITLVESKRADHQATAAELIEDLLPETGKSIRLGITGVPGVGKSTFIEALGLHLIALGKKPAVLSIDPSSSLSHGSILGDKTRMNELSRHQRAFVRPSPSGTSLGGVAKKTRETIYLCEAAGFDVIIVETVGVGQSETVVKDMVDFFLLLMLSGGGDDLQGIKRGIMEMADGIAINKADGANKTQSTIAARTYQKAMHLFPPSLSGWTVPVTTCSAQENEGIAELWEQVLKYESKTRANDYFRQNRTEQNLKWYREGVSAILEQYWLRDPDLQEKIHSLEEKIRTDARSVSSALAEISQSL
ncbi:MAG: methylmalonyl Co-A mutase-associated GTPase MeaB [Cytophagales bacterium]|nr:methylmalonyl Co-A mutase-associated GTPase MeaB [Cytophagales bacterium]